MLEALVLAFGLAMDAAAVALVRGAIDRRPTVGVGLALAFGAAQAGMAALGWLAGDAVGATIARWDHWIAFGLLAVIGGKMIASGWRSPAAARPASAARATLLTYAALAVATSIDALAAGLTLPLFGPPLPSVVAIGVVTAVLSGLAFAVGGRAGARLGPRAEIAGGVVLVGIGVRILIAHLTA